MLAVLRPMADWRVLDAGCGDGRFAASIAKHVAIVIGIDASDEMLRAAGNRPGGAGLAIDLACADVSTLPFASDSFDAVTAVTVLCLMPDPVAALKELARVVRPGGRVVVGELGRWSPWALQRRVAARRHGGLWNSARFWSKRTLSAALIAAELMPRDVRGAVFYPKSFIAARLLSRFDASFGAFTTVGAAFIAIAAEKVAGPS